MLMNVIRVTAAIVVMLPCASLGQEGVGEKCLRDVLATHIRDQKALKGAPPQGPVMESVCRSEKKLVSCHYYDNRNTPSVTLELRTSFAKVKACFEQFGKAAGTKGDATQYNLPIESCYLNSAQSGFDAWSFSAGCGPRL